MKYEGFYLIALGSNQPLAGQAPDALLRKALAALTEAGARDLVVSRFFTSPAFPAGSGPDFVNAAARLRFDGSPAALMALLHRIEARFSRRRETRWAPRTLDLDLIAAGDLVLPDAATLRHWIELPVAVQQRETPEQLLLPHPRLQERGFVLLPLAEIAPDWCHPILKKRVPELCAALPPAALEGLRPL